MEQWITIAPNGESVTIQVDAYIDRSFNHKQVITDKLIAERYSNIFRPYVAINKTPKKQMLTEVPQVEKVEPELDKPVVPKQDILAEVPEPSKEDILVEVPEVKNEEILVEENLFDLTNKQLIARLEDKKIALPKTVNKANLIKALTKG